MVDRPTGAFKQFLDYGRRGWDIGIADAKIDEVDPTTQGFTFAAVDFGKEVRR
jgi:hypothetical protein